MSLLKKASYSLLFSTICTGAFGLGTIAHADIAVEDADALWSFNKSVITVLKS